MIRETSWSLRTHPRHPNSLTGRLLNMQPSMLSRSNLACLDLSSSVLGLKEDKGQMTGADRLQPRFWASIPRHAWRRPEREGTGSLSLGAAETRSHSQSLTCHSSEHLLASFSPHLLAPRKATNASDALPSTPIRRCSCSVCLLCSFLSSPLPRLPPSLHCCLLFVCILPLMYFYAHPQVPITYSPNHAPPITSKRISYEARSRDDKDLYQLHICRDPL
jgi:hypothetical protein